MNSDAVIRELLSLMRDAGPELLSAIGDLAHALKSGHDPTAAERRVEVEAAKRFLEI